MSKKDMELTSRILMGGALVAVIFSAMGYLGTDIWIASTQWLLISAILALFGIYTKVSS